VIADDPVLGRIGDANPVTATALRSEAELAEAARIRRRVIGSLAAAKQTQRPSPWLARGIVVLAAVAATAALIMIVAVTGHPTATARRHEAVARAHHGPQGTRPAPRPTRRRARPRPVSRTHPAARTRTSPRVGSAPGLAKTHTSGPPRAPIVPAPSIRPDRKEPAAPAPSKQRAPVLSATAAPSDSPATGTSVAGATNPTRVRPHTPRHRARRHHPRRPPAR